jgi:hypothetical protein
MHRKESSIAYQGCASGNAVLPVFVESWTLSRPGLYLIVVRVLAECLYLVEKGMVRPHLWEELAVVSRARTLT